MIFHGLRLSRSGASSTSKAVAALDFARLRRRIQILNTLPGRASPDPVSNSVTYYRLPVSKTKELIRKYGEPNIVFDGLSWCAYIAGANMQNSICGEDPIADEAYEDLLENLERKVFYLCLAIEQE